MNKYLKEQHQIHKDVEKKRKSNKDLQGFYNEKYNEAIKLQVLRYKYFSEKHSKLLKRFEEIWKEIATEFPNITAEVPEVAEDKSEKPESKHTEVASRPTSEKPESRDAIPSRLSLKEEVTKPIDIVTNSGIPPNDLVSPISQPDDTIGRFFKEYDREEVDSFPKDKSDRSSIQSPYSAPRQYSGPRHNPLENYSTRPNLQHIYIPVLPSLPRPESVEHTSSLQQIRPIQPIQTIQPTPPTQPPRHTQPLRPPSVVEAVQPLPKPRQNIPEHTIQDSLLIPVDQKYVPIFNERYSALNHIDQSTEALSPRYQIVTPPAAPPPAPPRKGNIWNLF